MGWALMGGPTPQDYKSQNAPRTGKRSTRSLAGHAGLCRPCTAPPPPLPAGPAPRAGRARRWRGGAGCAAGAGERGRRERSTGSSGSGQGQSKAAGSPCGRARGVESRCCPSRAARERPRRLRAAPAHLCGGGGGRWHRGVRSRSGGTTGTDTPFPGRGLAAPPGVSSAGSRSRAQVPGGLPGPAGVTGSGPPLELRKVAAALPERGPSAAGPGRALPRRCRPVRFGSPRVRTRQWRSLMSGFGVRGTCSCSSFRSRLCGAAITPLCVRGDKQPPIS